MTRNIDQFIQRQTQEFLAFRRALTEESDRGCALFAAAYLDKALSDLLYLSLVEGKNIEKELFEGSAPLATFSSRIKLGFYLGKLSAECRKDLDIIRKIRNDFAHHASLISFNTQSIATRCRNLGFSYHLKEARPRAHFTAAASGLLALIQGSALQSIAPKQKPDDRPSGKEKQKARKMAQEALKLMQGKL